MIGRRGEDRHAIDLPMVASRHKQSVARAHWLFRAMVDPLNFKFVNKLRPPCSRCGRPLVLTRIEPHEIGSDLRTYYCAACKASEAVIASV
jgi:hypothetical protein